MISHQHVEAISTTKQEAKWTQDGSKSMEHARSNGFVTEALMPLGGKSEIIATNSKTATRRDWRRNHG
jgi:hypothetical protein